MTKRIHGDDTKKEEGPRYTVRLSTGLNNRLAKLGRIEKRKFAGFFRTVLSRSLTEWDKTRRACKTKPAR